MKKLLSRAMSWLTSLGVDKYLHFIAGLIVASFFSIVLNMSACIVAVVFVAYIKEFIDEWRYGGFDWRDLLATVLGGAVIQIMVLL